VNLTREFTLFLSTIALLTSCENSMPNVNGTFQLSVEGPTAEKSLFATLVVAEEPLNIETFSEFDTQFMLDAYSDLPGLNGPPTACLRVVNSPLPTLTGVRVARNTTRVIPLDYSLDSLMELELTSTNRRLDGRLVGHSFDGKPIFSAVSVVRTGPSDETACLEPPS